MISRTRILCMFAVLLFIVSTAQADVLNGRSRIGLFAGYAGRGGESKVIVSETGVNVSSGTGGAMGGLIFGHWLQENMAVTITISGHAIENDVTSGTSGVTTQTTTIGAIHPGIRYYFPKSALTSSWRPFLSATVGPFIGYEESTEVFTTITVESNTEIAFGAKLGAGLDIQLSRMFMIDVYTGYNLMTDFADPIGGRRNYSSGEFSFGLSYLFGHAK
ncbi:MAG: hypothetical protein R3F48_02270 [Candidatus Zixiibacteriota bacterium]